MDEALKEQVRQIIEDRMEQYKTPDEVRQTVISNLDAHQNDFIEVLIAAVTMWHHLYKYPDTPTLLTPK